jgi:SNF2 family DNA or RNA helicase
MPEPLFPFQEVGAQWLVSKTHAFLADEMRVGKTPQAIRACDLVGAERILVLCPAIARMNWQREFVKFSWTGRRSTVLLSSSMKCQPLIQPCLITSYDLAIRPPIRQWIQQQSWDVVILDEAHYLKNSDTKRTQLADRLKSRHGWRLSGTPAPNHSGELYPFLRTAGVWSGTYDAFADQFCVTETFNVKTKYGWIPKTKIVGSKNIPQLKALIAPFFLRRRLKDVAKDLPPMLFSDVVVEATEPDIHVWFPNVTLKIDTKAEVMAGIAKEEQALQSILDLTGKGGDGSDALAALQNAKTTTSRRWTVLKKIPAICEIITEELLSNAYAKIVIFAWHRDAIKYLHLKLKQFNPQVVYGGTPALQRDRCVHKFKTYGQVRVFIGNIQAAGVAIDLSCAQEVAFVEASWVPGENAQAAMRVHHLKQTAPVRVRFFSLAGSVDERIQDILRRKTRDLTALFDDPAPVESVPVLNPFL